MVHAFSLLQIFFVFLNIITDVFSSIHRAYKYEKYIIHSPA